MPLTDTDFVQQVLRISLTPRDRIRFNKKSNASHWHWFRAAGFEDRSNSLR